LHFKGHIDLLKMGLESMLNSVILAFLKGPFLKYLYIYNIFIQKIFVIGGSFLKSAISSCLQSILLVPYHMLCPCFLDHSAQAKA
jgi:hypothetical protein